MILETPPTVSLSVCLSCKGILSILEKNLQSLESQTLDKNLWQLVLLVPKSKKQDIAKLNSVSLFPNHQILITNPSQPIYEIRNKALSSLTTPVLYFIDEDVILSGPEHLSYLLECHREYPTACAIGGNYLNHPESSFFGRSYNWITRLWGLANPIYMPAGNLSLKKNLLKDIRFYSPHPKGFGGEEIYLLEQIKKLGLKILQKKQLDVFHLAKHCFKDFYKRAFYHGYSLSVQKNKIPWKLSLSLIIKTPESFTVKAVGMSYLLLVRFVALLKRLRR